MPQRPALAPNLTNGGSSPRRLSWRLGVRLSPLPISALLISAIVHAGASGALLTLGYSVDMPVAEPETAAIAVEIIPETTPQTETPTQLQKGEPEAPVAEAPIEEPQEDVIPPDPEPEDVATLPTEVELPDAVPMPVQRPKAPPQQKNDKVSEKPKKAQPKGIEREPVPDIALSDKASEIRTAQTIGQYASLGSETRNVRTEQRWLGQLAAHLERRKRYPQAAQSRRLEGTVRVRFLVLPDGTVTATQLISSSGITELDDEVLNLLDRASPLPKPPLDVNPLITVPVNFSIKR